MPQRGKSISNHNKIITKMENDPGASTSSFSFENADDTNAAEVVLSNKGGPKLIHLDYMYTLHKKQPFNIRWRCVHRTKHCRGSVVTSTTCTRPRVRMEHNHEPDIPAAQFARQRFMELGRPCVLKMIEGTPRTTFRSINAAPQGVTPKQENKDVNDKKPITRARTRGEDKFQSAFNGCPGLAGILKMRAKKSRGAVADRSVPIDENPRGSARKSESNVIRSDQQRERNRDVPLADAAATTTSSNEEDIVEAIQLEDVAMKQEPEDEDDCYLEATEIPSLSPSSSSSSANRHAGSSHRVRSHARSLRAMTNPSAVWAHFDLCVNDPLRAQCRICGAVVVRGGANPRQCGTTNLHRHLRVHHGGRLIGSRYHVLQSPSPGNSSGKNIRIAAQSIVRSHIRNIAPTPAQQQQQQRQPKTLLLKTIPLKNVAPTTIKLPPRQANQGVPHNVVQQQPTEVCLRWNSYHSNMQNSFPSLLDTEQFVDVTLACEGRSLKCHKMILSACSDYLADLLRENPCQHPIILMKDLKFWEVEALVKFMYRGEVNVAHDKLPQLLNAAEALQVKGLAGPNPSSQNPKPPLLIPQSKTAGSQSVPRTASETKEKASTSGVSTPSSPKRAQKRQHSEPIETKPFTKIRLQRPATPTSPIATVKLEPLDIPLSPTEMFPENNEDSSTPSNFEKLMSLHEEDDPGGSETIDGERELNFCEISEPPDINDSEDQMEFVPTDFLEQEQDIVEETDVASNKDCKEESRDFSPSELEDGEEESEVAVKEESSKEKKPV